MKRLNNRNEKSQQKEIKMKNTLFRISRRLAIIAVAFVLAFGPGRALAQRPLGVDVSNNNGGGINWGAVKGAGFSYAWAKATEGVNFIDADFTQNENNGKGAGLYMG